MCFFYLDGPVFIILDDKETCLNGGIMNSENKVCECPSQYFGSRCEIPANPATNESIEGKIMIS